MSKAIITNTTGKPVFVAGKLLGCGMSMEVEAHQVPDCLNPVKQADTETKANPATGQATTEPPKTDEERLVEAVKAKGK